jgi:type I restriction enzyme, S subunit
MLRLSTYLQMKRNRDYNSSKDNADYEKSKRNLKRLETLGSFKKGKGITKDELVDTGLPCVRYGEIYTVHDIKINKFYSFISSETAVNSKEIHYGDILFAGSGETIEDIGKAVAYLGNEKAFAGGDIVILSTKPAVDPIYCVYALQSNSANKQKRRLGQGQQVVHISQTELSKIEIPLPSIPEQRAIAACLGTWDKAIAATTALIAQKELRKKWLMQQLLTGKKRLKGFEKKKWVKLGAGEIFRNISTKGHPGETLLSATQDRGMIPRHDLEARVTMPSGDTSSFKLVEPGDFVISLRSFQGGLEYSYYRGLVSPAYTVLKPIKEIIDEFYKYYFKSTDFVGHLATAVIGIRDGKQISYDDFCFVKVPYPSVSEQNEIAKVLLTADQEIRDLYDLFHNLQRQKDGLMQKLLTGKERLKVN